LLSEILQITCFILSRFYKQALKLIFYNKDLLQSLNPGCSGFMKILNIMGLLLNLWVLGIQPINQQHLRHKLATEIIRKCILKTSIIFTLLFWHTVDSGLLQS